MSRKTKLVWSKKWPLRSLLEELFSWVPGEGRTSPLSDREHTGRAGGRVFGDSLSSVFSDMTEMLGSDKVWTGVGVWPDLEDEGH